MVEVKLDTNGQTSKVAFKTLFQSNTDQIETGEKDMVNMPILNEPEILHNIKKRYSQNNIFTYIGPTLIVMNPY